MDGLVSERMGGWSLISGPVDRWLGKYVDGWMV